ETGHSDVDPGVAGATGNPVFIAAGNLTGDAHDELVVSRLRDMKISIFFNQNNQLAVTSSTDVYAIWNPMGLAIADVDGDGHADVVVNTYNSTPGVIRNQGGGQFTDAGAIGSDISFDEEHYGPPAVSDFNHDGIVDFAYSNKPAFDYTVDVDIN